MSEYQLYEFASLDAPLTTQQQRQLREISTRAEISSSSFRNEYNWGDLRADPLQLVKRYFDIGIHVTNWGTRRLMLRLPNGIVDRTIKRYARGAVAVRRAGAHSVVDIHPAFEPEHFNDAYDAYDDVDDTALAQLIPVRTALMAGDLRPLYFAWLAGVHTSDLEDTDREPPVPAGLAERTTATTAIARFLGLDARLIKTALSKSQGKAPKAKRPRAAIKKLLRAALEQIAEQLVENPVGAGASLRRALRRVDPPSKHDAAESNRVVADLRSVFAR